MEIRLECASPSCRNLCIPELLVECPICDTPLIEELLAVHACARHENTFYRMPFGYRNSYTAEGKPKDSLNYHSTMYQLCFAELANDIYSSCERAHDNTLEVITAYYHQSLELISNEFESDFTRACIWLPQWLYTASLNHFPSGEDSGKETAARAVALAQAISNYMLNTANESGYEVSENQKISVPHLFDLRQTYIQLAISGELSTCNSLSLLSSNPLIDLCLEMLAYRDESIGNAFDFYLTVKRNLQ